MLVLKQVFTFLKRAVPLASFFKSVCISDWPVTSLALDTLVDVTQIEIVLHLQSE
jgi:hypothetical protein